MNYEKPTDWVNFGDINPEPHGGIFVKWTNDHWEVVETHHPDTFETDGYMFMHYYVYPDEIFQEGEVENGFTEQFKNELESVHNTPFDVSQLGEENDLETDMKWVIMKQMNFLQSSIAHFATNYVRAENEIIKGNYWEILEERFGITEESNE